MPYDEVLDTKDALMARRAEWDSKDGRHSYPFRDVEKGVCGYVTVMAWKGGGRAPKDFAEERKTLAWYEFGKELAAETKVPKDTDEVRKLLAAHGAHPDFILHEWHDAPRYGFVCRDAAAGKSLSVRMDEHMFLSLDKDSQRALREDLAFGAWDVPAQERLQAQRDAAAASIPVKR